MGFPGPASEGSATDTRTPFRLSITHPSKTWTKAFHGRRTWTRLPGGTHIGNDGPDAPESLARPRGQTSEMRSNSSHHRDPLRGLIPQVIWWFLERKAPPP
jgi:hypothetical protein